MKINRIEIENFGKLHDFTWNFFDGMNIISKENEFGKTTMMSFIYMMFYGKTSNERSQDIQKSLRKKYLPWNQQPMAGAIEFQTDQGTFFLHKTFAKSAASDIVSLINLDSKDEVNLAKDEEIGERFFDLDAASFEKSMYIGTTGGYGGTDNRDDLALRLSNLMSSGDEQICGSDVLDRIVSAKEHLISRKGNKGRIPELKEEAYELQKQIGDNQKEAERIEERKAALRDIDKEYNDIAGINLEIKSKYNKLYAASSLPIYIQTAEKIKENEQLIKDNIEQRVKEKTLKAGELINQIEAEKNIVLHQTQSIDENLIIIDEDEYAQFCTNVRIRDNALMQSKDTSEANHRLLFIFMTILFLSGAVGLVCMKMYYAAVAMLTVGIVFLFLSIRHGSSKEEIPLEQINDAKDKIKEFLNDTGYDEGEVEEAYKASVHAIATRKLIKESEQRIARLQKTLCEGFKCNSYENAKSEYDQLKNRLFLEDKANDNIHSSLQLLGVSREKLLSSIDEWENIINAIGIKASQIRETLKQFYEQIADNDKRLLELNNRRLEISRGISINPVDIEADQKRLSEITEKISDMEEYCQILDIARDNLQKAIEATGSSFGPKLNKMTSDIFSKITGDKYSALIVDRQYKISVREKNGAFHEWKYLSNGTIDQAYLALRLALSQIITENGESLPLFLDDVLIQYDSVRKKAAMEFLTEYSKDTQIIYFTHS